MAKKRGGKREGAGRPKKDYKTKVIAFRVRLQQEQPIRNVVKEYLKNYTEVGI